MRQHIDKIKHYHIQLIARQRCHLSQQLLPVLRLVHLMIRKTVILTETVYLRLNQRSLIQILPLFALLVHPKVGKHRLNLHRHQSRKDSVTRILRSRRQNAVKQILLKREVIRQQILHHPPLVKPEIINQNKKHLVPLVQQRKHLLLEKIRTHQRAFRRILHPPLIIPLDKLPESMVSLLLLSAEQIIHLRLTVLKLQLPVNNLLVHLHPVVIRQRIVDLHTDTPELLPVTHRSRFRYNHILVDILLDGQQQLVRIDRLDKIIRNLVADRLIHDALLLALGHHNNGNIAVNLLDKPQRLQARKPRHILIQKYNIKRLLPHAIHRIPPTHNGDNLIPLLPQKQNMRSQQLNLIISP
ncbi:hypothetical protein Barb6_03738 [Bacteroidales bacterium Barb6]|nr:hypothetical protein Barb6_03738 [Bacteroidales bacterium Barb6]